MSTVPVVLSYIADVFDVLRAIFAVVGAVLSFRAGHLMRVQGSGIDFSFGLLAYAVGFALLAYAASGLAALTVSPMRGTDHGSGEQGSDHRQLVPLPTIRTRLDASQALHAPASGPVSAPTLTP